MNANPHPARTPRGPEGESTADEASGRPACPVCGGKLVEIRAKFHCADCHRICETCCEGGRG